MDGEQAISRRDDSGGSTLIPTVVCFPARVIRSLGKARYLVREQQISDANQTVDVPGAADVHAINLAELDACGGADLAAGTVVLIIAGTDHQTPPTLKYVFDHPIGEMT